jgi:DNA-binding NarL/FixJ family response regulator
MSTLNAEVHVQEPHHAQHGTVHAIASSFEISVYAQDALRLAAIAADASATTTLSLALLWLDLTRGTSSVVDAFFSEERYYLVLGLKTDGGPVEGQRLEILEAMLGGLRQKNIAIDLALAPSTVALHCMRALISLGLDCKPSRAHPLLMHAATAFNTGAVVLARCSTLVGRDDRELRVIGMPRVDRCLAGILPSAELAVIRWLVEGLSYEDIAQERGTTVRTIANQISSVFRRLNVSGRNELVQLLFFDEASGPQPPGPQPRGPACAALAPPTVPAPDLLAAQEGTRRSA